MSVLVERDPDIGVPHERRQRFDVDARGDHQRRVAVAALVERWLPNTCRKSSSRAARIAVERADEEAPSLRAVGQGRPVSLTGRAPMAS